MIPSDLLPGSPVDLRLVMTKFGPPEVHIDYEIWLRPASIP